MITNDKGINSWKRTIPLYVSAISPTNIDVIVMLIIAVLSLS